MPFEPPPLPWQKSTTQTDRRSFARTQLGPAQAGASIALPLLHTRLAPAPLKSLRGIGISSIGGVPSERVDVSGVVTKVAPWAGMRRPVGAREPYIDWQHCAAMGRQTNPKPRKPPHSKQAEGAHASA
jgi:hypothetical protein